jgi:hypothetical protein
MSIDYTLASVPQGGLTFDFVPSHDSAYQVESYFADRNGPDVFSITESAFLFLEKAIADAYPNWSKGYHWGLCYLPTETWLIIFGNLRTLRFDIRTGVHPKRLLEKHVPYRGFLMYPGRLNRKALLNFLDRFEHRARELLTKYPYLVIGGI